jgi:transposase-like protein
VQGISTRSVDELVKALGMSGVSKSQVSRLCAEIDERVATFLERPLEGDWPYLWIDATYLKVRQNGRVVSVAVTIAVAVNGDGRREVLGMGIGASEAETFWLDFLRKLKRRGLAGVKLVISDAHEGIKSAVARYSRRHGSAAASTSCATLWLTPAAAVDASSRPSKASRPLIRLVKQRRSADLRGVATAFAQDHADAAKAQWRQVADQVRPKLPKLASLLDEAEEDVLAYMTFPKQHRAKIHSTNPLERLNGEIKRRTDVVGIFPNEAAITRGPHAACRMGWHPPRRRDPPRAERRMGRPEDPLHDAGNHRSVER